MSRKDLLSVFLCYTCSLPNKPNTPSYFASNPRFFPSSAVIPNSADMIHVACANQTREPRGVPWPVSTCSSVSADTNETFEWTRSEDG